MSYAALAHESARVAAWLREVGAQRGDRIVLHLPKTVEEVVATFACTLARGVFVNVNWQLKPRQLEHVQADCAARILITEAGRARRLAAAGVLQRFEHVLVRGAAEDLPGATAWDTLPATTPEPQDPPIGADLAALLYTSGSTGRPKGVMVTHDNLVQGAASVARYLGNTSADRVLGLLPLSFDYGLSQVTTMALVGGTVVLQPVSLPPEILATIRRHEVTGMAAVPTIWTQFIRFLEQEGETPALPSLRYITNSGGKIPDAVLRAIPDVLPATDVFLMYGLTEAFRSTWLPPALFRQKMGSMGRAIPNVEIFVVSENGVCGPGETGELVHRGALISRGYWGDPELSAARIRVNEHLRPLLGEEKVLHSGDMVTMDEDGFLWFVGRNDHLIKSSGVRISPTEVEELAYESPLVDEAVAFGMPDDVLGEVVHLAVSGSGGADALARLERHCRTRMPGHMVPARIWVWDGAMPRTSSGKLDRSTVVATMKAAAGVRPGVPSPAAPAVPN
jgi:acyl-CoA ligase (AMP-forming) (exosortase A-associated)